MSAELDEIAATMEAAVTEARTAATAKVGPDRRGGTPRLPPVAEKFPELIDPSLDAVDEGPSCSAAEALSSQEALINASIVMPALGLLARFFRHGEITWHGGIVDLRNGRIRPQPVPASTVKAGRRGRARARAG